MRGAAGKLPREGEQDGVDALYRGANKEEPEGPRGGPAEREMVTLIALGWISF